jgi:dTMP kinase
MFVCLIGIDGSGKTTLASRLVKEMQASRVNSRYVWGGFAPTLLLRPVLWLAKHSFYRESRDSELSEHMGPVLKNKGLAQVYHRVVLADYVLQMLTRVGLRLLRGESVVCDRYIHDTVITTAIMLEYPDGRLLRLLDRMQRLVPRPDLVFLADLAEEVAFARKDDNPSIAFLAERRRRYLLIAEAHGLPVLDASQPVDLLVQHVLAEIS